MRITTRPRPLKSVSWSCPERSMHYRNESVFEDSCRQWRIESYCCRIWGEEGVALAFDILWAPDFRSTKRTIREGAVNDKQVRPGNNITGALNPVYEGSRDHLGDRFTGRA